MIIIIKNHHRTHIIPLGASRAPVFRFTSGFLPVYFRLLPGHSPSCNSHLDCLTNSSTAFRNFVECHRQRDHGPASHLDCLPNSSMAFLNSVQCHKEPDAHWIRRLRGPALPLNNLFNILCNSHNRQLPT